MGMLDGKCALITGSTSGFGRAGAITFAREGAAVAVVGRNPETGAETVRIIHEAGGKAVFIRADMTDMTDVERMVRECVQAFGRLDVFWHNAGDVGPGNIEETSYEAYDKTMTIHLKAGFFGAKFAVAEMKKVGAGVILFTSSLAGLKTSRSSTVYGVAKAAQVSLTKNLALTFAPYNVRVNVVCAGASETPAWAAFNNRGAKVFDPEKTAAAAKMYREIVPLKRLGEPQEIANSALFLCSDMASYITGAILPVDGGLSVT